MVSLKPATIRKAWKARQAQLREEGWATVRTGKCPCCGQGIHANLALTNWYQCAGYGADGFRKANAAPCSWQVIIPE